MDLMPTRESAGISIIRDGAPPSGLRAGESRKTPRDHVGVTNLWLLDHVLRNMAPVVANHGEGRMAGKR